MTCCELPDGASGGFQVTPARYMLLSYMPLCVMSHTYSVLGTVCLDCVCLAA